MNEKEKLQIVIDKWLFDRICDFYVKEKPQYKDSAKKCKQILCTILNDCHTIFIDRRGEIRQKWWSYWEHPHINRWLIPMWTKTKIKSVRRREFSCKVHHKDKKYVETALNTSNKILITGDEDLIEDIEECQDLEVKAWSINEAVQKLEC